MTIEELRRLPPTITVPEAAAILRISRNAAYAAIANGEIPALHLGRTIRVPTARLLDLLGLERQEGEDDVGSE